MIRPPFDLYLRPGLASAGLDQGLDLANVFGVDESRTGEDRETATDGIEVGVEQIKQNDRQVSLHVLLLVDRKVDVARLDGSDDVS